MQRMSFAPLRYSLAIVRFPQLMKINEYVPAFQDLIRGQYPLASNHSNQGLSIVSGPEGVRVDQSTEQMWQFADRNRSNAIVLGSDFILVHAGQDYVGHEEFLDRLRDAVQALKETPGIEISYASSLGLRVIDLVEPRPGTSEDVGQYLQPWALPTATADMGGEVMSLGEAAYIASLTTKSGTIRFQALRRMSGSFPPDLNTPLVRQNGWIPEVKADDFVFLDIDHFAAFEGLEDLDPGSIREKLEEMYLSSRRVFEAAATPFAFSVWKGEA